MENVPKKDVTMSCIIQQVYDANVNMLSLCDRLTAVVDKLLVGALKQQEREQAGYTEPVSSGDLNLLDEHAMKHRVLNDRLESLVTRLEISLK